MFRATIDQAKVKGRVYGVLTLHDVDELPDGPLFFFSSTTPKAVGGVALTHSSLTMPTNRGT